MTNIETRKQSRIDIKNTLKKAGLVEGITLTDRQLLMETKTCFWHGVVRNEKSKAKDAYVTFHISASNVLKKADNTTFYREVVIAIDAFSKRSFDSASNYNLLENLEKQFTKDGYEVEMAEEFYENETSLFHYPITIFKIY